MINECVVRLNKKVAEKNRKKIDELFNTSHIPYPSVFVFNLELMEGKLGDKFNLVVKMIRHKSTKIEYDKDFIREVKKVKKFVSNLEKIVERGKKKT